MRTNKLVLHHSRTVRIYAQVLYQSAIYITSENQDLSGDCQVTRTESVTSTFLTPSHTQNYT